jgi:hypothetical protein
MVWNNSIALSAFVTSATTSSTNFGVLVCVIGFPYPYVDDPSSYTIILPNSNGSRFANSSLLSGTYNYASLNSSKTCCVTTLSICSAVACRPSCVYYYYCYKCYCKCWKCFRLVVVSIQSSHISPSKCRFFHPLETLCHVLC